MPKLPPYSPQISLGNIITLLGMLLGLAGAWFTVKQDIRSNAQAIARNVSSIERVEVSTTRSIQRLDNDIEILQQHDGDQSVELGRIDERLTSIQRGVAEIKQAISRGSRD